MGSPSGQEVVRAKIVMVGAPEVGKTSLVRRFVHSIFTDEYSSTLGVKVDRKVVMLDGVAVSMVLWDMHGETEGLEVPPGYLRGASAALGVFDATRPHTAEMAALLLERVHGESPNAVTVSVANKSDLIASQAGAPPEIAHAPVNTHYTSALTGDGVDGVFLAVAQAIAQRAGFTISTE